MIKFSHAELDRRVRTLEESHRSLEENGRRPRGTRRTTRGFYALTDAAEDFPASLGVNCGIEVATPPDAAVCPRDASR